MTEVQKFDYLGSTITEDGRCESEMKWRIGIVKNAFQKMKNLLTNRHVSIRIRVRAAKTYVWSTSLYGFESWTINKEIEKRLEELEIWCWRRMLKVCLTERRTKQLDQEGN